MCNIGFAGKGSSKSDICVIINTVVENFTLTDPFLTQNEKTSSLFQHFYKWTVVFCSMDIISH